MFKTRYQKFLTLHPLTRKTLEDIAAFDNGEHRIGGQDNLVARVQIQPYKDHENCKWHEGQECAVLSTTVFTAVAMFWWIVDTSRPTVLPRILGAASIASEATKSEYRHACSSTSEALDSTAEREKVAGDAGGAVRQSTAEDFDIEDIDRLPEESRSPPTRGLPNV